MYLLSLFIVISLVFSQKSQWLHLKIEQSNKKARIKSVFSGNSSTDYFQKKNKKNLGGRLLYEVFNSNGSSIYKSEKDCYCHIRVEEMDSQVAEISNVIYGISIPRNPDIDKIVLYHYWKNERSLLLESEIKQSRSKLNIDEFKVTKVLNNGKAENLINLVFLAEGFQKNEMDKFAIEVQKVIDKFSVTEPFKEYRNYFNIYRIDVESKESGSSHPQTALNDPAPPYTNDTYFKSSYDGGGGTIHRLLVIQDEFKAELILNSHTPFWNQAFFIVNDEMYGGSGGRYAVSSNDFKMPRTMLHEIGHSFGDLSDEYDYGSDDGLGFESINTTLTSNRKNIKWGLWIENNTPIPTPETEDYKNSVGLFEGAGYVSTGCYRPQLHCKMRNSLFEFCVVCKEQLVYSIYKNLTPNFLIYPNSNTVVSYGESLDFSIEELSGIHFVNSLRPKWYLNNKLVHTGYKLSIQPYDYLPLDEINLKFTLTDQTDFVRIPEKKKTLELIKKEWRIQKKKRNYIINSLPEKKNLIVVKGKKLIFKVDIINRTKDTYQEWLINDELSGSLDSLNFNSSGNEVGNHKITYSLFNNKGNKQAEILWNIDIQIPSSIKLEQNYPNPFNPSTSIRFQHNKRSKVTLRILNSLGQIIKTLLNHDLDPGIKEITWDGKNSKNEYVSSGIYFYNLKIDDKSITKKMVLLK